MEIAIRGAVKSERVSRLYKDNRILGIVPARGGSKGVKGKNKRSLFGKPTIAWTIEEALKSKYLDKVVVSTDDEEIANISWQFGAEVPFLRPLELAGDEAGMMDTIFHAINFFEEGNVKYHIVMLLQPTSPLRNVQDIDTSVEILFEKKAQAIVSVCEAEHHPYLSNALPPNGCLRDFVKTEVRHRNRQNFPKYFRLNGAIYLAFIEYLKKQKSFFGAKAFAYVMPIERSIDIDRELDIKVTEFLLKCLYE